MKRPVFVACIVALAGSMSSLTAQATPSPEPRETTTLTLGTTLPDTGSLKAYGPATQTAVQLAVDDANAAWGVLGADVMLMAGD